MYGSASCCMCQWPSQRELANSTPTAPKPLNRSWWNSNLRTISGRPPTMQNFIAIRWRGWSRRITSLPLSGFFVFLVSSSRAQVAPVDRFDDLYDILRLSFQECAFWGFRWYACQFTGSHSPKKQFWGVDIGEIEKHAYHQNYCVCVNSNQILHSDKDHQMPSRVVQTHSSERQDGGLPPSWKNRHIFAKVWPIAKKFGTITQCEPVELSDS